MDNSKKSPIEDFKVIGNWDTQSKALKVNFPQLTDTDLKFETAKETELLGRMETRLNKQRSEVINIIRKGQPAKI